MNCRLTQPRCVPCAFLHQIKWVAQVVNVLNKFHANVLSILHVIFLWEQVQRD